MRSRLARSFRALNPRPPDPVSKGGGSRTLAVDASFNQKLEVAGIGVAHLHGGALLSEIVFAQDTNHAEGLAVLRGLTCLQKRGARPGSVVVTDSLSLTRWVDRLNAEPDAEAPAFARPVWRAAGLLSYVIRWQPRRDVRGAHRLAGRALEAWRAGQTSEATWEPPEHFQWKPSPPLLTRE